MTTIHCFGRPTFNGAGATRSTAGGWAPLVSGWALGGLSPRDRGRLIDYVLEDPARGEHHRGYHAGPTRETLEDASGLIPADHAQLWSVADLVKRATWQHEQRPRRFWVNGYSADVCPDCSGRGTITEWKGTHREAQRTCTRCNAV